jgi:hypothetical protein
LFQFVSLVRYDSSHLLPPIYSLTRTYGYSNNKHYTKVYSKTWFEGKHLKLESPGKYDYDYLNKKNWNDLIYSIYLPWGYKAYVCSDKGYTGHCKWYKHSTGKVNIHGGVSSIKIVKWKW